MRGSVRRAVAAAARRFDDEHVTGRHLRAADMVEHLDRAVRPLDRVAAGALGRNTIERADGTVEVLDHIGRAQMAPGDVFVVETPGGGGYGAAD
nr:hydantoinase B/oxoprolinase family protein [Burkholderia cenocepacia]